MTSKQSNLKGKQKGFTIIEVVLVLAIAGLIFLIVFLALPQLQRSRRDTQRRNDAGRLLSALQTYAGNNNGEYPEQNAADDVDNFGSYNDTDSFLENYIDQDDTFRDPDTGAEYDIEFGEANADGPGDFNEAEPGNELIYAIDATCNGESMQDGDGDRQVAVAVELEDGTAYCQDNQ